MSNHDDFNEPQDKLQNAVGVAQDKAKAALQSGTEYAKANPVPVLVGALLVGAALGALLSAPRARKEPDAVQSVRDWLESSLDEISSRIPQVKKQACGIQQDLVDHVSALRKKFKI